MKETKIIMGMAVTVEVVDRSAQKKDLEKIFAYFHRINNKFSNYKKNSEVSLINSGVLTSEYFSTEMKTVLYLSEKTKKQTQGYFNVYRNKKLDTNGLVKGWAIFNAAKKLKTAGFRNFYVEAGGDIEVCGKNSLGKTWSVGIRSPFNKEEIVKTVLLNNCAIATSGTYILGEHIYNPHQERNASEIVSLSVIGPNILDADRFATAAFAMGKKGIYFIESLPGFEAYLIDKKAVATMTSGFNKFLP